MDFMTSDPLISIGSTHSKASCIMFYCVFRTETIDKQMKFITTTTIMMNTIKIIVTLMMMIIKIMTIMIIIKIIVMLIITMIIMITTTIIMRTEIHKLYELNPTIKKQRLSSVIVKVNVWLIDLSQFS